VKIPRDDAGQLLALIEATQADPRDVAPSVLRSMAELREAVPGCTVELLRVFYHGAAALVLYTPPPAPAGTPDAAVFGGQRYGRVSRPTVMVIAPECAGNA
jgi:hypothetical protein